MYQLNFPKMNLYQNDLIFIELKVNKFKIKRNKEYSNNCLFLYNI